MTTEKDIKLEYIHAIAEILMDLTAGDRRINVLVSLIHAESEENAQWLIAH